MVRSESNSSTVQYSGQCCAFTWIGHHDHEALVHSPWLISDSHGGQSDLHL